MSESRADAPPGAITYPQWLANQIEHPGMICGPPGSTTGPGGSTSWAEPARRAGGPAAGSPAGRAGQRARAGGRGGGGLMRQQDSPSGWPELNAATAAAANRSGYQSEPHQAAAGDALAFAMGTVIEPDEAEAG
jgi:hypothetical protein